jgi:hypothetical protein
MFAIVEVCEKTGVILTDDDGFQYSEQKLVDGFHINTSKPIENFAKYQVMPVIPQATYHEGETYCYSFPDEATFNVLMEALDEPN